METAKRITDKANGLFRKYGIRNTSMDTVAENVGISKKTLYQFCENKYILVAGFVEHEIETNSGKCNKLCQTSVDAIAELFMVLTNIRELFARLNPAIIHELEKNYPDMYRLLENYQSVFLADIICKNLLRGLREHLYRTDINRKLLSKMILESFILTLNPDFLAGETSEQWFGYLIGGMVSAKGFAVMEIYKNEFGILQLTNRHAQPFWDH